MAKKIRTVEHKSFTGPDYRSVLHSLEVYLNKYPTLELVSVQETNVNMRLATETTYEHFGTYFIVWSS